VTATGIEPQFDLDELMTELCRYLAAVEAFRAEGHEPVWLREERRRDALPSDSAATALPTTAGR
jgi:hypothetical protein